MSGRRSAGEPVVWLLFSGGGMAAGLAMPALMLLLGVVIPLGLLSAPDHSKLLAVLAFPLVRLALLALLALSLFHWAHRFRYTLQEGLQLRRISTLIAVLCYGGAVVGSAIAAYVLLAPHA
jgi:fumarate reductase subunit D